MISNHCPVAGRMLGVLANVAESVQVAMPRCQRVRSRRALEAGGQAMQFHVVARVLANQQSLIRTWLACICCALGSSRPGLQLDRVRLRTPLLTIVDPQIRSSVRKLVDGPSFAVTYSGHAVF